MAAFDWQTFLDRHGIDYVVQRKDIYIHCPFCGAADHGKKMGVSTVGKGWGCWRQDSHRGHAPERLIQALLNCSWADAQRMAGRGAGATLAGLGGFMASIQGALGKTPPAPAAQPLSKPKSLRPLTAGGMGAPFFNYLVDRGFTAPEVELLITEYQLHYAISGDWSYRIVIPVPDRHGKWYTWTGRAITNSAKLRYKTLTADPDKVAKGEAVARGPITDCFLGLPDLFRGGRKLVVAEGPFDAMRLSLFAAAYDIRATCLFGKAITDTQVDLLVQLRPLYDDIVFLLDPDAALGAMALQTRAAPARALLHFLQGDDDPGEMGASAIKGLLRNLPSHRHHG